MELSAAAAGAEPVAGVSSGVSSGSVTSRPRATSELMRLAKELGSSREKPEERKPQEGKKPNTQKSEKHGPPKAETEQHPRKKKTERTGKTGKKNTQMKREVEKVEYE